MNDALIDDESAGMDPASVQSLYARTLYRMRESRKALLKGYGVDEEAQLLERIRSGEVAEHPAYEHYLGALIIEQGRMHLREELLTRFGGAGGRDTASTSLHLMFEEGIEEKHGARLAEPVRLAHDALLLSFDTGLMMEVRYFSGDEFSVNWNWGEAALRYDTAPVHPGLAEFPRHVHLDDGRIVPVPAGLHDADPWTAFSNLVDILLVDPLLEQCTI